MWSEENEKVGVAPWWRNTVDASLPLLSDMAPYVSKKAYDDEMATEDGKAPGNLGRINSQNHGYAGENVVFADAHVDFVHRPDVGQGNDNIFLQGPVRNERVVEAGKLQEKIWPRSTPFDIVMVPTRAANGELK